MALAFHHRFNEVKELCDRLPAAANEIFQVYIDLKFGKLWLDVTQHVLEDVKIAYFLCREDDGKPLRAFVPMSQDANMPMSRLDAVFKELRAQQLQLEEPFGFTLSVVSSDSTVVYYRLFDSIVPPKEDKFAELGLTSGD